MSITIELAPELQAELVRQAATQGIGIDAYAASLIANAARLSKLPAAATDLSPSSTPSREVVEAIETLRSFGKKAPSFARRYDNP